MDLTSTNSIVVFTSGSAHVKNFADQKHRPAAVEAIRMHWPEYTMEAIELGLFMLSACIFSVVIFHPASFLNDWLETDLMRRLLMGLAMGTTAIAIIFSPMGKRSGAHFNPAVTLVYLTLKKIKPWDAAFYTLFQVGGGIIGVLLAYLILKQILAHPNVQYAVTVPGSFGVTAAFLAELMISFVLMTVILNVSNSRLGRWTGVFAGTLVATYITIESPISGMSMNPARTLGSAVSAHVWTALWIYLVAPPAGMLLASAVFKRFRREMTVACAKLHHYNNKRCIFQCNFERQLSLVTKETQS